MAQKAPTDTVAEKSAALDELRLRRAATAGELTQAEEKLPQLAETLARDGDEASTTAFNEASSAIATLRARLSAFDEHVVPQAEAALADAEEAAREAARVRRYEEAKVAGQLAADDLRRSFGPLAAELTRIQKVLADADVLVNRANADLPAGAARLAHPEADVRDQTRRPLEILGEEEVERWVYKSTGHFVPDNRLDQIEVRGPFDGLMRRGSRDNPNGGVRLNRRNEVVKIRCLKREFLGQLSYRQGGRLAKIDLGPLRVEATPELKVEYIPCDPS